MITDVDLASLAARWREKAEALKRSHVANAIISAAILDCADDLAALRGMTTTNVTRTGELVKAPAPQHAPTPMSEHPPDPARQLLRCNRCGRREYADYGQIDPMTQPSGDRCGGVFLLDEHQADPALIQSDDLQPSIGSAPPSPSLSASQRIREIRERVAKATKGPWWNGPHYTCDVDSRLGNIRNQSLYTEQSRADAEFIAHARQDIPWLLQRSDQDAETIAKLESELATERETSLNDPAEQRAERYALEASELTKRLMDAEQALAAARQEMEEKALKFSAEWKRANALEAERDAARQEVADVKATVIRHRDRNSAMFNASKDLTDKTMLLAATGACEQIRTDIESRSRRRASPGHPTEDDRTNSTTNWVRVLGRHPSAPSPQHAPTNQKASNDV